MIANQIKYPSELASHVVSTDVLSREVDDQTGILRTQKLIGLEQKVPGILNKILGLPQVLYFLEVSEADSKNKRYRSTTTNVDLRHVAILEEICEYQPNPSGLFSQTLYTHRASVNMTGAFSKLSAVEDVALHAFKKNSYRGRELLESVLRILETEDTAAATPHHPQF